MIFHSLTMSIKVCTCKCSVLLHKLQKHDSDRTAVTACNWQHSSTATSPCLIAKDMHWLHILQNIQRTCSETLCYLSYGLLKLLG